MASSNPIIAGTTFDNLKQGDYPAGTRFDSNGYIIRSTSDYIAKDETIEAKKGNAYLLSARDRLSASSGGKLKMIDNYIYLYHVGILVVIPTFPDSVTDTMSVKFQSSEPLSRTAPIQSYVNSGPRTIDVKIKLHRDMMSAIDYESSKLLLISDQYSRDKNSLSVLNDNYVDVLIRELQAIALPRYAASEKMVNPPMIAVRFGDDIFIKGIVNGSVSVSKSGPILRTNKYAVAEISFNVTEVDPYDADTAMQVGSFRGLSTSLERSLWIGGSGGSSRTSSAG